VTRRPNGASAASDEVVLQRRRGRVDRGVGAEGQRELALVLARRRGDDPPGAERLRELDGERADPAGGGVDDDGLPGRDPRRGPEDVPRRRALEDEGERLAVLDAVGDREGQRREGDGLLGVAAARDERDDAAAVLRRAGHLGAGDEGELLRGEVGVLRLVGVGVVHARGADRDAELAGLRLGRVDLDGGEDLGSAELADLDRAHAAPRRFVGSTASIGGTARAARARTRRPGGGITNGRERPLVPSAASA
jgi:hypothetical protein